VFSMPIVSENPPGSDPIVDTDTAIGNVYKHVRTGSSIHVRQHLVPRDPSTQPDQIQ